MVEFVTGLVLGGMLVFFAGEYRRVKLLLIPENKRRIHTAENIQWQNMMNYDGTERGQERFEN